MLRLCNVSLRLGGKALLDGVSFSLKPQRLTALVGRNGSGKSTLLSCVNQRLPYTGSIWEEDRDLARLSPAVRARSVAILPQTLPAPHITAREMAAFGRNPWLDLTGRLTDRDRKTVEAALEDAGALELGDRFVDTLSGGERQRVALAMILAQDTPIALLDEPTAHMDQAQEAVFLQQLTRLKQERQKTFLVVLHDLAMAVRYADDLAVLEQGRLVFAGPKEECLDREILERTFSLRRCTCDDAGTERIFFTAE